jgi:hypothetical protein
MATDPLRRKPEPRDKPRPKIWAEGEQRPSFNLRAFGRASLHLSREGVAPLHAWAARTARRVAVNVKNGAGRIPEEKLGRAARFVPSHLRVAAWIKNGAAILSHASATADPDVKRGNALVLEIEPHLWPVDEGGQTPPAPPVPKAGPVDPVPMEAPPVVLAEPMPQDDPLAAIRDELAEDSSPGDTGSRRLKKAKRPAIVAPSGPAIPPGPPGEVATGAIQVLGFMLGWLSSFVALPYGLAKAGWLHIKGVDLRQVGSDD